MDSSYVNCDRIRYDDHIRSVIECESKGSGEKDEREVREEANRHIGRECWHSFVKVLKAIRLAEQEEYGELAHLHRFIRSQRAIRHGWLS